MMLNLEQRCARAVARARKGEAVALICGEGEILAAARLVGRNASTIHMPKSARPDRA